MISVVRIARNPWQNNPTPLEFWEVRHESEMQMSGIETQLAAAKVTVISNS